MSPQADYRQLLLSRRLPPVHSSARRRLVLQLRWHAGLPIWMHGQAAPPAQLAELVTQARVQGPGWTW